jgi:hypothetical protein
MLLLLLLHGRPRKAAKLFSSSPFAHPLPSPSLKLCHAFQKNFVGRAHHRTIHQVTMQQAIAEALADDCKKNGTQITIGDA